MIEQPVVRANISMEPEAVINAGTLYVARLVRKRGHRKRAEVADIGQDRAVHPLGCIDGRDSAKPVSLNGLVAGAGAGARMRGRMSHFHRPGPSQHDCSGDLGSAGLPKRIRQIGLVKDNHFSSVTIDITYPSERGAAGMGAAVDVICAEAEEAVLSKEYNIIILSDRGCGRWS